MDQNFKADSFERTNVVKLKELKYKNGSQVAVLEYYLQEHVSGDLSIFIQENNKENFYMTMSHRAIGEFDLDMGRWIRYEGMMDLKTNFSLIGPAGAKRTQFLLIPSNN